MIDQHAINAALAAWNSQPMPAGQRMEAALKAALAWRPMQSAPRDGDAVLLCLESGLTVVARYNKEDEEWTSPNGSCPDGEWLTGWLPLPPAPEGV